MKSVRSSILVTFIVVACIAHTSAAVSQGSDAVIQIHGELIWRGLTNIQTSAADMKTRFSVILNGCRYRMEETEHPTAHPQILYSDGTYWYHEVAIPKGYVASNVMRMTAQGPVFTPLKKPVAPKPILEVSPIIEPILPRITSLLPIWMAFGSGCHFVHETSPEIPAMFVMKPGPLSQIVLLKADRALGKNGGLESYTDYWDTSVFAAPPPSPRGLTNIAFQVTTWTNFDGTSIPATFRFLRYYLAPTGTPKYYQSMDGSGRVTKIDRLNAPLAFRPTITTNTLVAHFSAMNWEPVTYSATNGLLKTQEEVDEGRR